MFVGRSIPRKRLGKYKKLKKQLYCIQSVHNHENELTCKWGHAASSVGSSSSGSYSAPAGFADGGNERNIFTANYKNEKLYKGNYHLLIFTSFISNEIFLIQRFYFSPISLLSPNIYKTQQYVIKGFYAMFARFLQLIRMNWITHLSITHLACHEWEK